MKSRRICRCVVTGGPGSGKTTLIEALKDRQHQVAYEVATAIIKRELEAGREHPAKNRDRFEKEIMHEQIRLESLLNANELAFLDRGIIDGLVYYQLDGLEAPEELKTFAKTTEYDLIFFLDFPSDEFYIQNEVRTEPIEEARRNHMMLEEMYKNFGCANKMIKVAYMSVEQRVDFVCKKIIELESSTNI